MSKSTTYSVILSGNLKPGFETDKVIAGFAKLFVVPFDQATRVVGKEYVVKEDVTLEKAEVYRQRLDGIGLEVKLERHDDIDGLALEDIPEYPVDEADAEAVNRPPAEGHMRCPACNLEQPDADQCSGCGVYMRKVMPPAPLDPREVSEVLLTQHVVDDEEEDDAAEAGAGDLKLLIAPAIVALLGALLWYLVAVVLDMEFGAIALLIGYAVSFAATRGDASGAGVGIACAVLVALSICVGKYLYLADLRSDPTDTVSTVTAFEGVDLYKVYAREVEDARQFATLSGDDESLMKFLVEREYGYYRGADEVPYEEIRKFRESIQPRLEYIAAANPTFDQWRESYRAADTGEVSTFGLMVASVGGLDMLFLLLGIGTAFLLAYRGRKARYI